MTEYHKIQSVFKRDPQTNNKRFLMWKYSLPEFAYLAHSQWIGTEKVDGTNVRLYKDGGVYGKTNNAQLHTGLTAHLYKVSEILVNSGLPDSTVLYGEGYGAKIQSGGHYIPNGQSFVLFDVMINGNWQPHETVIDIANELGIQYCPVIGGWTLVEWVDLISKGWYKDSFLHPGARNEGVVLRPGVELKNRVGDRVITKLKFKDFGL